MRQVPVLQGQKIVERLAARRQVEFENGVVIRTPLIVPSFSSKGFPDVADILKTMEEAITECVLVSAYDVLHDNVPASIKFPEFAFLDSGGYETSQTTELSDLSYESFKEEDWKEEDLKKALGKWDFSTPTVLVNYDHPKRRHVMSDQIRLASNFFKGRRALKEILIKPETLDQRYLAVENVIANIAKLKSFDIVGFTEKELGNTLLRRMVSIATIRSAMNDVGLKCPIHIFGSLDTISTPLYFLSGADIFDGLTWLRFAYLNGYSVYVHDFAALNLGLEIHDQHVRPRIWFSNYYALQKAQRSMRDYLSSRDLALFEPHASMFERAFQSLEAELSGR